MKLKATFLLAILLLAVTISAKQAHNDHHDGNDDHHHDDDDHDHNDDDGNSQDGHDIPDFEQIFEEIENFDSEEDEEPQDPVGQALYQCIRTNYFPWDDDHKFFVHVVNDRCQHFQGQQSKEEIVDFFQQTINCVNNTRAPRQSIKVQLVAAIQCVIDKINESSQDDNQALVQKKKVSLKSQRNLKRRRV